MDGRQADHHDQERGAPFHSNDSPSEPRRRCSANSAAMATAWIARIAIVTFGSATNAAAARPRLAHHRPEPGARLDGAGATDNDGYDQVQKTDEHGRDERDGPAECRSTAAAAPAHRRRRHDGRARVARPARLARRRHRERLHRPPREIRGDRPVDATVLKTVLNAQSASSSRPLSSAVAPALIAARDFVHGRRTGLRGGPAIRCGRVRGPVASDRRSGPGLTPSPSKSGGPARLGQQARELFPGAVHVRTGRDLRDAQNDPDLVE